VTPSGVLIKILGFLRGGYPEGAPGTRPSYPCCLLRPRLSDDEITALARELAGSGGFPVDGETIGVAILKFANQMLSPADTVRVKQRLATTGRPVSDQFEPSR
jgi:hypothetical protein